MPTLCRDCRHWQPGPPGAAACPVCRGRRLLHHPELDRLTIAHIDCDAFYAAVEKRERPDLFDRPLIIGGGTRGVVTTACYIARLSGVRSAMPMFKALKACPDATVIAPNFPRYVAAAREMRALMRALTPLVQPLSIDEAVLDLDGTQALHGAPPASVLAGFALAVEARMGITVSIGLAANRLMAKLAAERDKPRGMCAIGSEAPALLATEPVGLLPGVGPALAARLARLGITVLGQLQRLDDRDAVSLLGPEGPGLVARSRGQDDRPVRPDRDARSISAETTFDGDIAEQAVLEKNLWRMAEKLARRLQEAERAAAGVVLKLKSADFTQRTRHVRLAAPTRLPDRLFAAAATLLAREIDGTRFRLIGIGAQPLAPADQADRGDLVDTDAPRQRATQSAIDRLRARFGADVIGRGRGQ